MSLNCMRARLSIVIVSLVAISFAGCDKTRIRGQLKTLMDAGIVLPDSLKCVSQGRIGPMPDSLKDRPKLVVYIDTDECTTCCISHFSDYQKIYDLSRETASEQMLSVFMKVLAE